MEYFNPVTRVIMRKTSMHVLCILFLAYYDTHGLLNVNEERRVTLINSYTWSKRINVPLLA